MIGKYGQLVINNKEELINEIGIMLPHTSIHLIGPSGSGKTTIAEDLMNIKELGIDELKIIRLQGVSSEDFRLPVVKTVRKSDDLFGEKEEKVVELINMGVFQEILDNPSKTYLVLFDEILRADATVAPLLFGLLEGRINGIKAPNLRVICASNYGEEYITNFDFSDSALRRRQIFIEYVPSKDDILDFMREKEYNNILLECVEMLDKGDIINHDGTKYELEQDTQLGSWNLLNERWKSKKVKNYKEARNDISVYGPLMLNGKTISSLVTKLTLLEQMQEIDFHKEIIKGKALEEGKVLKNKKGVEINKDEMLTELKIRTKTFILNETLDKNNDYMKENFKDILEIFKNDKILMISLITDLKNKINSRVSKTPSLASKLKPIFINIIDELGDKSIGDDKVMAKLCSDLMETANLQAS